MIRGPAWWACGLTVTLAAARGVLAIADPGSSSSASGPSVPGGGVPVAAFEAVVLVMIAVIGAMVASRQPRNPVGWMLCVISVSLGLLILAAHAYWSLALARPQGSGAADLVAWLASWIWIPAIVPAFTILPLLFPTGQPLSRRWGALRWVAAVAGILTFAGQAFTPGPLEDYPDVVNPLGIDGAPVEIAGAIGFALLVPTALMSIASLVVRFRRSRGAERQQLKWVAAAAVLLPVSFSGVGLGEDAGFGVLLSGLLVVASAMAVAMLRYRLYDIDVVINRTLVYGVLTATLAGTYVVSVLLLQLLLTPLTEQSDLAIAGSTLAVAGLFGPARGRIQAAVDRRFYRRKYDAARTLERFGVHLRDEVDLEVLGEDLRAAVADTMAPAHVSLWLRVPR